MRANRIVARLFLRFEAARLGWIQALRRD